MLCEINGCNNKVDVRHHVVSRGKLQVREIFDVKENIMDLCDKHHREIHDTGRHTFALKHGIEEQIQGAIDTTNQMEIERKKL